MIEKNLIQNLHSIWKPGDLIITWKKTHQPGQRTPFFINQKEQINELVWDSFCAVSLAGYLKELNRQEILPFGFKGTIHITCKPCDARSVMQLFSDQQISPSRVNLIVLQCEGIADNNLLERAAGSQLISIEEVENQYHCKKANGQEWITPKREYWLAKCTNTENCDLPYYYQYTFIGNEKLYQQRVERMLPGKKVLPQDSMEPIELKKLVQNELSRCIRCNACRNVCPACFCAEQCIFEKPKMNAKFLDNEVSTQNNILYHMIRFHHVAPNCTGCGECERACPREIPLHMFYEYFNRLMKEDFSYKPGKTDTERQKLLSYHLGEDLV